MVDPGRLVLVVASGETAGTALDLDRELVLGRDEDAGLPLDDPKSPAGMRASGAARTARSRSRTSARRTGRS